MEIVRATREEVAAVDALLQSCALPPLPPAIPLSNLLVARDDGALVGAIALTVAGRRGLLRSLVVAAERRGAGLGAALVSSLLSRAHELGLRDLHLLTENAADFFERQGFDAVSRDVVPQEIRETREFREQCPESAQAMRLRLSTRF
jgi:amino-acid N-acetyltransferase